MDHFVMDHFVKESCPIWTTGRRVAWKEQLMRALCRHCGCTVLARKASDSFEFTLVGRESRVASMRRLWTWLVDNIHNQGVAVCNGRVPIGSFCLGFVDALDKQVQRNPSLDSNKQESEARRWMDFTNFSILELPSCNNAHVEHWSFEQGQIRGNEFVLNPQRRIPHVQQSITNG